MLRVLQPTNQNCLAANQVAESCEKLLQKVDLFYFLQQNLYTLHVLPAQDNLVLQQVTLITSVHVSQYSHNLQQVDLL